MSRKRQIPTHYLVGISIVCEKRGAEWVAVVTDMPVRGVGATREEAIRAAQLAGVREIAEGRGPAFSAHEEIAAAVAAATVNSMWRFIDSLFKRLQPEDAK